MQSNNLASLKFVLY